MLRDRTSSAKRTIGAISEAIRRIERSSVLVSAGATFVSILTLASSALGATRYVFTTFRGDGAAAQKLSVYTSTDGLNFTLLSDTGFAGPTGVLRDPSIIKHSDGRYYVAYTLQSWSTKSASFGIAASSNLLDWTFVTEVPAQIANASYTWAPDWFIDTDGSVNLVVSIDNGGSASAFSTYLFTATNETLTAWSTPTPIGIGPNYIDTFIVKTSSAYHAFSKNETTKYIEHATAPSLTGPWTWVGTGNWANFGSGKEGPALFQLDDGQWRMFMDCYTGCGYLYTTSADLNTWSTAAKVPLVGSSAAVRHGAVLREWVDAGASGAAGAPGLDESGGAAGASSLDNWGGAGVGNTSDLGGVSGNAGDGNTFIGGGAAGTAAGESSGAANVGGSGANNGSGPTRSESCGCVVVTSSPTAGALFALFAATALIRRRRGGNVRFR